MKCNGVGLSKQQTESCGTKRSSLYNDDASTSSAIKNDRPDSVGPVDPNSEWVEQSAASTKRQKT